MCVPSGVGAALHLQQASLVKSTGVDVDDMAISRCSVSKRLIVLHYKHTQKLMVSHVSMYSFSLKT